MDDVIIIGGSFAGLTAALQLGRARRRVTVLDTGLPRNRYASEAHGVLGHDGTPPATLLAAAREQLRPYDTVRFVKARADSIEGKPDDFRIMTEDGESLSARRLVLSYGITDLCPAIPGFAEAWGKSVIHCPYCHGYEVAGRHWGLIYSTPMSLHATNLYGDWTDRITLFTDGNDIPEPERSKLDKRGVTLVEGKVTQIEQSGGQVAAVHTEDGARIALDALFAHPRIRPSAPFHEQPRWHLRRRRPGHRHAFDHHRHLYRRHGRHRRPGIDAGVRARQAPHPPRRAPSPTRRGALCLPTH